MFSLLSSKNVYFYRNLVCDPPYCPSISTCNIYPLLQLQFSVKRKRNYQKIYQQNVLFNIIPQCIQTTIFFTVISEEVGIFPPHQGDDMVSIQNGAAQSLLDFPQCDGNGVKSILISHFLLFIYLLFLEIFLEIFRLQQVVGKKIVKMLVHKIKDATSECFHHIVHSMLAVQLEMFL